MEYERKLKCELYNDSMQEEWKDVKGYEGLYQVSNKGNVKSLDHFSRNNRNGGVRLVKGKILTPYKMPNGYYQVQFSKNDKREKKYIHRLVADAFIDNTNERSDVNHIDGNKANNCTENLEWLSHKDNQVHMVKARLTRKAIPVRNLKTGKEYDSLIEAAKDTGVERHYIKKQADIGLDWGYC